MRKVPRGQSGQLLVFVDGGDAFNTRVDVDG